jgi:RHH-type transcriptional regulator, rel operon repressor / antitoxin RelB
MLGITESEWIRKSLSKYLNRFIKPSPWELGKNDFGKYSSGQGNLSTAQKQLLKAKIQAK